MNGFVPSASSEPAVPGDDEDAAAVSPEPEPEVEKEAEAAAAELKAEATLEAPTELHASEEPSEKGHAAAPPTADAASGPSEAAAAAPEESRVGPGLAAASGLAAAAARSFTVCSLPPQSFSWASVTSKNLPPSGAVPASGIPPHVVKVTPTAPVSLGHVTEPPPAWLQVLAARAAARRRSYGAN